jgi:hypothetical protein
VISDFFRHEPIEQHGVAVRLQLQILGWGSAEVFRRLVGGGLFSAKLAKHRISGDDQKTEVRKMSERGEPADRCKKSKNHQNLYWFLANTIGLEPTYKIAEV